MGKKRAIDWLRQAQNDFEWAQKGLEDQFFSQVCFMCQQSGEKAIKSIAYYREYEIRGHSITKIAKAIGINSEIEEAGKNLDIFYISSRYPDALPEGAPFEIISKKQAEEALQFAGLILKKATDELG